MSCYIVSQLVVQCPVYAPYIRPIPRAVASWHVVHMLY